jgi:hypothetical protein
MAKFAKGKHALAISDRSGLAFPWREMVTEWNGQFVHYSEFERKQPQLEPKPFVADPQGLETARPARTEFPTEDFLPDNPFVTASYGLGRLLELKINFPNGDLQVNDMVRFRDVKSPVGGVAISTLQMSTTLNGAITDIATTINLTDGSQFPTSGFIVIEKVNSISGLFENEVIQYTGRSTHQLTGCVRGTSAQYRGVAPKKTTASSHSSGAKVFGAYKVISLNETSIPSAGQPSTTTQFDGINVMLTNAPSETATGGGFQCTIGPINDRG